MAVYSKATESTRTVSPTFSHSAPLLVGNHSTIKKTILPKKKKIKENQDGGVGRHTAPPHTTRTDRKSNGKEVRHQGNKK